MILNQNHAIKSGFSAKNLLKKKKRKPILDPYRTRPDPYLFSNPAEGRG
jgi:hypothetical protein